MPQFGIEVARQRLTPAYFSRTVMTGEMFAPQIDRFLHEIEVLRDPSHGRNYRILEWFSLFADASSLTRERLHIELNEEGVLSFVLPAAVIVGVKPA